MILRNLSSRNLVLNDSVGTQYILNAYSDLSLSDSLWSDQTFRTQLRYQIRNVAIVNVVVGVDVKAPVRVATTANITLSGTQTIDAVAVIAADRVLVKNQTNAWDNGIYVVAAGAWARSADAIGALITDNMFTFVQSGTANANTGWVLITPSPRIIGTTPLTFSQFSGSDSVTGGLGLTRTGNVLDVNVDNVTLEINADTVRNKALGITDAHIAAANKDGVAGTPSLRTLGTGATQAASGNDPRFSGNASLGLVIALGG